MRSITSITLVSCALGLAACGDADYTSGVAINDPARPRDATANLPSDSGSQSALPTGAVTGAGQPYGTTVQADVGADGGLEQRARERERAMMSAGAARAPDDASTAAGATSGIGGAGETRPADEAPARAPREARG